MKDEFFLRQTFRLARENAQIGLDPFGALLVLEGKVMANSTDQSVRYSDPTAHAELVLISEHCRKQKLMDLRGYTLYSSAEPCIMCSGAIHWAKISRVVFGVSQARLQQVSGGKPKPASAPLINSGGKSVEVIGPMLEEEGLVVLREFPFRSKRARWEEWHGKN